MQLEKQSGWLETSCRASHKWKPWRRSVCISSRGGRPQLLLGNYLLTRPWYITSSPQSTSFRIYLSVPLRFGLHLDWLKLYCLSTDALPVRTLCFLTPVSGTYSWSQNPTQLVPALRQNTHILMSVVLCFEHIRLSDNVSGLYSGDLWFESRLGNRQSWPKYSVVFLRTWDSSIQNNAANPLPLPFGAV
jgi:hypothetical protein